MGKPAAVAAPVTNARSAVVIPSKARDLGPCRDWKGRFATMTLRFLLAFATSFASAQQIQFRDITAQAGIHFVHNNGAFGKKFLPETMGTGTAFIDYDNDGWPDIFLVNGMDWPGHVQKHSTPKLYHNNQDGTVTDANH